MKDYTTLQAIWFLLISVLWLGYFLLEGYDFGVGMLFRNVGRNNAERRAILHTIGPLWDGNEVWLITAGGATFAAFPDWYATLFSGFYVALFALLAVIIVRNVVFEFWGKRDDETWRNRWAWAMVIGSAVPALLWGVAWANIVHGVPIDGEMEYTGTFFDLLKPYALLGGLATLTLFLAHGAIFLSLRTTGEMERRALAAARMAAPVAALLGIGFLAWTVGSQDGIDDASAILAAGAAVSLVAAAALARQAERALQAFVATAGAIVFFFTSLFVDLFPHAMVSSTSESFNITLNAASSSTYTLAVMTVVAVLLVPVVLLYQAWSHWVFRHRLSAEDFGEVRTPLDLLEKRREEEAGGEPAGSGGGS